MCVNVSGNVVLDCIAVGQRSHLVLRYVSPNLASMKMHKTDELSRINLAVSISQPSFFSPLPPELILV